MFSDTISRAWLLAWLLIAIASGCKTPSILVTEEQQKGDYFSNQHDYAQAVVHYDNMLDASMKLGIYRNLDMEADVCRKIAHAHSIQGAYDRAITYMLRALEKDSIQGNTIEIIEDFRELGKLELYRGDFPAGRAHLQHALDLNEGMDESRKGINQLSIADTYLTLSQLFTVLGDFRQGELYGLSALKIYSSLGNQTGEMESLLQLGKILVQMGSGRSGEQYVISSMKLAEELGLNTYRQLEALAHFNENNALYEEALRLKLQATDEVKGTNNLPQIIWAHILTGDLYGIIGDQENAREYYFKAQEYLDSSQINAKALEASASLRAGELDQAYSYFSGSGMEVAAGVSSMRLGELALEWKFLDESVVHFRQALEHFVRSGWPDGMARAGTMLGLAYQQLGNNPGAKEQYERAKLNVQQDETAWRLWFAIGQLYEAQLLTDSAIEAYRTSIEIIERIRGNFTVEEFKSIYLENKMDVYNNVIRLLMEGGYIRESLMFSERARARTFLDMLGNNRIQISKGEGSELAVIEQDLRQEIQSLTRLLQKEDMGLTRGIGRQRLVEEIFEIQEQYNQVITQIKLHNPEYASMVNMETTEIEEIQSGMDAKEAFLVYWVGTNEMYIWMVSRENINGRRVPIDEDQTIDLVSQCRKSVGSRKHLESYTRGYQVLIAPFEAELAGLESVGIVPHLSLHFLPYQCLMPDSTDYLIDHYNLFYTPSLSAYSLSIGKQTNPEKQFLALALGDLELGGLPALPGTAVEVSRISTLFSDPDISYGTTSTESHFKSTVEPFEYVHLATHGILDQRQPMFSYLVLAPTERDDGQLTVNEIFELDLNAKLVVLSACETGLGSLSNGDEIIGLSRAFLFAGAKDVIVSLWSVADEPTAYLMTQFYSNLATSDPVDALRHAQIATRKQYSNPVYWAPFQLIGAAR